MHDLVLSDVLVQWAKDTAWALAILVVGIPLTRLLVRVLRRLLLRAGMDQVFVGFASTIANIVLLLFVVILALDRLGIDTSYLFALLAAVLLALGLALQDSLSNVAAGMRLFLDQPFKSGDQVEIAGVTGYVEQINLMSTKLRSAGNVDVVVPNAAVASSTIHNFSARMTRRIDLVVRISHDSDVQQARAILLDLMKADPRVLESPQSRVTVRELADTGVDLNVRPWVNNQDYAETRWGLVERIKVAFDQNGITIPHPQLDVHVDGRDGSTVQDEQGPAEKTRVSKPFTGR
jgi:small conductance mechanosensitive channel